MTEIDDLIQELAVTGLLPKGDAPYSEGPLNARIAFVGEAPGKEEELFQRPFIGAAGSLFNELLQRAGIIRELVYIDNVFQFRPFNNNITPYIKFGRTLVKESEEFKQARTALIERLRNCKANVIVPLGKTALYAITGEMQITKQRGSIFYSESIGKKVIPTLHPAAALRKYIDRHFIKNDLTRIKKESEFPEIRLLDRDFMLEPTMDDVCDYIHSCHSHEMIGFDIEVTCEEVSHVGLSKSSTDAICIPFYEGGRDYFTAEQESTVWSLLDKLLSNPNVRKLGQNIIFDATFVHRKYGICVRPVDCTMIAAGILFPDFPKGLGFLVSIYCDGEPYYKDDLKKWMKNPFADNLTFRRYNAMDAAVLHEIFPQQVEELKKLGNYEVYRYQVGLIEPLNFMQQKGLRIDVEGLKKESFDSEIKVANLKKELREIVGYELNTASSKQMQEYFYEIKRLPAYKKSIVVDGERKSVTTCDEKALKRIAGKGYKEAQIALEIRHYSKMKSTYYDIVLDEDDRLRCSFNPITKQGRLSSSKTIFGTGGNLQNQPSEMKRRMLADEGYIFVNLDLAQAENRIVAYIANVSRMVTAFENSEDVHRLTASLIFNKSTDEISDVDGSSTIGGGRFSERDIGKRSNHGYNYGLGPDEFAVMNEISRKEGRFIYDRYHAIYPEIRQWHASLRDQLSKGRTLINSYGRRRLFMERWGDVLWKGAYNFIPQSNVADKINREGILFIYYNQDQFTDVVLLNQVHDSIIFEYPLRLGPESLALTILAVCRNLESPVYWKTTSFIIPVDVGVGFNLGKCNKENPKGLKEFSSSDIHDSKSFTESLRELYNNGETTS